MEAEAPGEVPRVLQAYEALLELKGRQETKAKQVFGV
jgi:hypothetical protein